MSSTMLSGETSTMLSCPPALVERIIEGGESKRALKKVLSTQYGASPSKPEPCTVSMRCRKPAFATSPAFPLEYSSRSFMALNVASRLRRSLPPRNDVPVGPSLGSCGKTGICRFLSLSSFSRTVSKKLRHISSFSLPSSFR
eukprot:27186_1